MKINIMFQYIDPTRGGIENTSYYLYKAFSEKYDMAGVSRDVEEKYKLSGVRYYPRKIKGLRYLFARNNWQYKNSKDKDNTYNLGLTWFNVLGAYRAKKKYGTPYLCLIHGDDIYFDRANVGLSKKFMMYIKRCLARRIIGNANAVCINSKNTQKLLHKTLTHQREIIIHPGINYVDLKCEWKRKEEFVIFSLGRIVERKGIINVIKSIPELLKVIPKLKYYIAGDGPLKSLYEKYVNENGLENNVFFLGRITEEEKIKYMNLCDVFIMPSIEIEDKGTIEGFGIVYIEANMAGRYVVGSNTGGIPDAIIEGVTGHLLEDSKTSTISRDLIEIFNNLEKIYTEDLILERKMWAQKHSFENISKQYEKVMLSDELFEFW